MQGRLTSFQKTMLQWNDLHPYNAVHVVRLRAALDLPRLQAALHRTFEPHELAGVRLDRNAGHIHFDGSPTDFEVRILAPAPDPAAALVAEIERQLNTPFAAGGRLIPFRFFIVAEPDQFALGLVYFHPIGDAHSVVGLLKELTETYLAQQMPAPGRPLELYPRPGDRELFGRPGWLRRARDSSRNLWRITRTTCRPPLDDRQDPRNAFRCLALSTADLQGVLQTAKAWSVTVNDLFLAALLQALSPVVPFRHRKPGRRRLALGTIVNTRRDLGLEGSPCFGLVLGAFVVMHEAPEDIRLQELARAIHEQTERVKQAQLYLATPLQLAFLRLVLRFFSTDRRPGFYQKHYPLWGGITNMNLNSLWEMQTGHGPVDYLRAVSTGPATPLVLSITTVRDHVNIGLSYRPAVFSPATVTEVQRRFVETVEQLRPQS